MPAEPEVVGVDTERHLPANKSIYVGEYARFLLVFDPAEFICNENDFETSDDDVTVTMEEGADNVVRISVGENVGVGSVVEVRFRGQLFMNVTAAHPIAGRVQISPNPRIIEQRGVQYNFETDFFEITPSDRSNSILEVEVDGVTLRSNYNSMGEDGSWYFADPEFNIDIDGRFNILSLKTYQDESVGISVKLISLTIGDDLYTFDG